LIPPVVKFHQYFTSSFFIQQFFCAASKFGFVIFWQKDFGTKAAHKMLVNLTPDWQIQVRKWSEHSYNGFDQLKNLTNSKI
jgi:hypothetical protein